MLDETNHDCSAGLRKEVKAAGLTGCWCTLRGRCFLAVVVGDCSLLPGFLGGCVVLLRWREVHVLVMGTHHRQDYGAENGDGGSGYALL